MVIKSGVGYRVRCDYINPKGNVKLKAETIVTVDYVSSEVSWKGFNSNILIHLTNGIILSAPEFELIAEEDAIPLKDIKRMSKLPKGV
jgi:hypothetical protein